MTQRRRDAAYVALGLVIAAISIVMVVAVLAAAVSAGSTQSQLHELQAAYKAAQAKSDAERDHLLDQNRQLLEQSRRVLHQNRVLVRVLRRNGLDVPPVALPQSSTSGAEEPPDPKASATHQGASPAPSSPAGPGTTATPTPTAGPSTTGLDPVCALLNLPTCPLLP